MHRIKFLPVDRVLDGHFTAQVGVLGTVDFAHTALADLLNDFVMADRCADHRTPSNRTDLPRWYDVRLLKTMGKVAGLGGVLI